MVLFWKPKQQRQSKPLTFCPLLVTYLRRQVRECGWPEPSNIQ